MGSARDLGVDVVGLPGVVSVMPFATIPPTLRYNAALIAERAWMQEPVGKVHIKVPLGPAWPGLTILFRAGGQQVGAALTGT